VIATLRARRIRLERPQAVLLILCVFFGLVNVLVVANLFAAERQRDALAAEAVALERTLQRLQSRGATPGQLAAELRPGESPFPAELPTADLANLVVQSAQGSGAALASMTPQLGGQERLAQNAYRTYRLSIRASGSAAQLADFLNRVQHGSVRSWVMDNGQLRPTGPGLWEMTFDLTAYAQAAA
jgi:Tfp pilus assembly protein PilO